MLQQDEPEDFVIATGKQFSVRDFVVAAGSLLDMKIEWEGEGIDEVGIDTATGRTLVRVDPRYFRPTEVETLLGDPTKARQKLGWTAEIGFSELVAEMVERGPRGGEARCPGRERGLQGLQPPRVGSVQLSKTSSSLCRRAPRVWWARRWCGPCGRQGYENLLLRTHSELDLTDQLAVRRFFEAARPRGGHHGRRPRRRNPCQQFSSGAVHS